MDTPVLNYDYALKINVNPSGTKSMEQIAKGFKNVTEALNEVLFQGSFLGDGGYGSTFVTGGQLIVTLTGIRISGDEAQDYIFSDAVYYNWGSARETVVELSCPDGTVISCPVTLAKINRSGGDANQPTAVTVEIHFNGKPTIIDTSLSTFTIGSLTLIPTFSKGRLNYTASTDSSTATITATASDTTNATVVITNGTATVTSGSSATFTEGVNTVKAVVTNGGYTKTYTVAVTYTAS